MSGNDFNTWGSADGNIVFQVMQGIHSTDVNHSDDRRSGAARLLA